MRYLVQKDENKYSWKTDPFKFYDDEIGKKLVDTTVDQSVQLGRNPNAVGKSATHWANLFSQVKAEYLEIVCGKMLDEK